MLPLERVELYALVRRLPMGKTRGDLFFWRDYCAVFAIIMTKKQIYFIFHGAPIFNFSWHGYCAIFAITMTRKIERKLGGENKIKHPPGSKTPGLSA